MEQKQKELEEKKRQLEQKKKEEEERLKKELEEEAELAKLQAGGGKAKGMSSKVT